MLNFEEELAKFQPSPEVAQAEDMIYADDMKDVGDIMKQMLEELSAGKNK